MLFAANLLGNWHVMMGVDPHNFWPPGSPSTAGFAPHGCVIVLNGMNVTVSKTTTVDALYHDIIHQGSDIGNFIPHIQANLLLPLIIAFSGSKSQFGVNTVQAQGKPVAVACGMIVNINTNCAEPVYTPTGLVPAMPMTVQAGFTLADLMSGLASMAFDTAISGVMFLFGKVCEGVMAKLFNNLTAPLLRNTIRPTLLEKGMVGTSLFIGANLKELPQALLNNLAIGTPLGWSGNMNESSRYSSIFNLLNVGEFSDSNIREPVYNYFSEDTDILGSTP